MRKLENKKLDEIGKMLVKSGAMPAREIDEIVAEPELFEGIMQRISMTLPAEEPATRRWFVRPLLATMAVVGLVAVVTFAVLSSKTAGPNQVAMLPTQPAPAKSTVPIKKSGVPDQVISDYPSEENTIGVQKAVVRTTTPSVRTSRPKQPTPQTDRFVDRFYAVSYAGDPHETERGGRIVRVDIPRSTLFAMGINVPLENESATVKADLLIGNDGVTRAIRVVE